MRNSKSKKQAIQDEIVHWIYTLSLTRPRSYKPVSVDSIRKDTQELVNKIIKIMEGK
jgi:hypothetical protein